MSHLQFHCIKLFILRHAWLNLWDKHMTTGRINQVTLLSAMTPFQPATPRCNQSVEHHHSHTNSRSCWRVLLTKVKIVRTCRSTFPDSEILSTSHNVTNTKANSLSDQRGTGNELPDSHAYCKSCKHGPSSSCFKASGPCQHNSCHSFGLNVYSSSNHTNATILGHK